MGGKQAEDDSKDVLLAQSGDMEAFGRLIEQHTAWVRAFVARWLQPTDVDDIVQTAWVKIHKALPQFQRKSTFGTWAKRIALNVLYDEKRKPQRGYTFSFLDESGRDFLEKTPDALVDTMRPDRALSDHEYRERRLKWLQWALSQLSEDHRSVIIFQFMHGYSYREIAEAMNCSLGTVMSRRFYAMDRLESLARKHNWNWDTPEEKN